MDRFKRELKKYIESYNDRIRLRPKEMSPVKYRTRSLFQPNLKLFNFFWSVQKAFHISDSYFFLKIL